ncbi:MAG TPA: MFS transporter [Planctomycetota bacterium]|nr:MFS transporter [Planctomycetota bacterium]
MNPRTLVYAAGSFGFAYTSTLFTQWIVFRHASRAAPALLALALGVKYLLEGGASPLVGAWTDRHGGAALRKRILVLGALPLAAIFAGLWQADVFGLLLVPLFGLVGTLVCQPYGALITSVSRTPEERNVNALASAGSAFAGAGAAFVLGPKLAGSGAFGTLAATGAVALAAFVFVPALFLEAGPPPQPSPRSVMGGRTVLWHAGMPLYLAGNAMLALGGVALMTAAPFVVQEALAAPPEALATLNLALVAGVVVAALAMSSLSRRVAPGKILAASGVLGSVVALGAAASTGGSQALYAMGFAVLGVTLFASVAAPPLILARFAEEDGRKREGAFFGLSGLATNVGNGAGAALTSLLMAPLGVRGLLVVSGLALLLGGVLQALVPARTAPTAEATPSVLAPT